MVEGAAPLLIRSEDEAWQVTSDLLSGRSTVPIGTRPDFRRWPKLEIEVSRGESIITPTMMRGFIGLQDSIYRTHTLIQYSSDDLRKLSDDERAGLEIDVKVSKGSSRYETDLWRVVEGIGQAAVDKMDPFYLTITLLGAGALLGGSFGWKWYLQHRTDVRKTEIQAEKEKGFLQSLKFMSQQETKRLKVFERALKQAPILEGVQETIDQGKDALLRSMRDYDTTKVNGVVVGGEVAEELSKSPRRTSEEVTLTGTYRVLRVDTTSPDGFRVRLQNIDSGDQLTAGIGDVLANEQQGKDLRTAEWSKSPVKCTIRARRTGEEFRDAVIKSTEIRP